MSILARIKQSEDGEGESSEGRRVRGRRGEGGEGSMGREVKEEVDDRKEGVGGR